MSDEPELSRNVAVNHSQTEMVQTCDENALNEDEEKMEVMDPAPFPPVGSLTASSSVADLTDNESELLDFTVPSLDSCAVSGVVKVKFGSNKANQASRSQEINSEAPPIYNRTDNSNSVACQTDWSWLAAYRAIKDKLPQESSSGILKSKSESKISKASDADSPQAAEMTASSLFDDLGNNVRKLESLKSDPWPDRADEYGIPINNASEDEEIIKEDEPIGKSVAVEEKNEAGPEEEEDEEETDEDEDDDDDDEDDEDDETEDELDGMCKFCGLEKKPLPSVEDQKSKTPEELYCCNEFREYIARKKTASEKRSKRNDRGQSSKASSSGDEGSKREAKARKKKVRREHRVSEGRGKERGERRKKKKSMRESKLFKDEFRRSSRSPPHSRTTDDGVDKPCVVYGHDMTLISYQLSSRQCMNWTLGVDSGTFSQRQSETERVIKPVQLLQGQQSHVHLDSGASLVCQTYDDGSPFLVIFPDGSGNVFYPSGQIAVSIITSRAGEYLYIIQDTNGRLLGIYEPNGKTVTYFRNGTPRVCTDETGGLEMDAQGNRRKQWNWNEDGRHVHAPPLYHITCSISSSFTFGISSQQEMTLVFSRSHRTCRFNVGSNPHHLGVTQKRPLLTSDELYIRDIKSRISEILQKTSTLLKLPGSPRLEGSLTPLALQKRRGTPSSTTRQRGSSILPSINQ